MTEYKFYRRYKYQWAASRSTETRANKLKDMFNKTGHVHAVVIPKKLGSKTALVPTVYEIWVRPTEKEKQLGGFLGSKTFGILLNVILNRDVY